ncbi:hypothetical protein RBB50_007858 [Rhinocladiella similis]
MISETDLTHLRRCVALARDSLVAGDSPFGSVLVSNSSGAVLREDRNRITTGRDVTLHPELALVIWAQRHLSAAERADTTVYTSGEHCPMCATAHANAGMGRVVYVASSAQLGKWREEMGASPGPVALLPISVVAPGVKCVEGPVTTADVGLLEEVMELHRLKHEQTQAQVQVQVQAQAQARSAAGAGAEG